MDTNRMAAAGCALGMLAYLGLSGLLSDADAAAADSGYMPERIELVGTSDAGRAPASNAEAMPSREAETCDGPAVSGPRRRLAEPGPKAGNR